MRDRCSPESGGRHAKAHTKAAGEISRVSKPAGTGDIPNPHLLVPDVGQHAPRLLQPQFSDTLGETASAVLQESLHVTG